VSGFKEPNFGIEICKEAIAASCEKRPESALEQNRLSWDREERTSRIT
jgi:hypothetical protein